MKLKFVNKVLSCKVISIFLLFLVYSVKLETIHELKCLSKNCDDLYKKGEVKFSQSESKDFLQVNKDTLIDIFGENDNNYLIKVNDKQGLIKKNFVVVKQDLSKDRQILTRKASFENEKILLLNESPLKVMFGKIKTQKLKENIDNQKPVLKQNDNSVDSIINNDNETDIINNELNNNETNFDNKVLDNNSENSEVKIETKPLNNINLKEPVKTDEPKIKIENDSNKSETIDSVSKTTITEKQVENNKESIENLKQQNEIKQADHLKNDISQNTIKKDQQTLSEESKIVDEKPQKPYENNILETNLSKNNEENLNNLKLSESQNLTSVENNQSLNEELNDGLKSISKIEKPIEKVKEPVLNSKLEMEVKKDNLPQENLVQQNNIDKNKNTIKPPNDIKENLKEKDSFTKPLYKDSKEEINFNNEKPTENQNLNKANHQNLEKTPEKVNENKIDLSSDKFKNDQNLNKANHQNFEKLPEKVNENKIDLSLDKFKNDQNLNTKQEKTNEHVSPDFKTESSIEEITESIVNLKSNEKKIKRNIENDWKTDENLKNEKSLKVEKLENLNNLDIKPEIKIEKEIDNKNSQNHNEINSQKTLKVNKKIEDSNIQDIKTEENFDRKEKFETHFDEPKVENDLNKNSDQLKNNQEAYSNYVDQTKTVDFSQENNNELFNEPVNTETSTFSNFDSNENKQYDSLDINSKPYLNSEKFSSDQTKENMDTQNNKFSTESNFVFEEKNLFKNDEKSEKNNLLNEKLVLPDDTNEIFSSFEKSKEENNFYSYFLKYTLGFIIEFLPESFVIFLEKSLKISANMIVMIFLVGLLWIISFSVKFFFISIDNEKQLKNQLCGYQSKLFIMNKEKEELMKSLKCEKLNMSKDLEESKLNLENSLKDVVMKNNLLTKEISNLNEELQEKNELFSKKEDKIKNLIEDNFNLIEEKEKLNSDFESEKELRNQLETKIEQLEEDNYNLKTDFEQVEKQIKCLEEEKENLATRLDESQNLIEEKEIKISCLNKMLEEFKDIEKITDDSGEEFTNLYDVAKLRCDLEKAEKEKENLKLNQDSILNELEILKKSLKTIEDEKNNYEEEKEKLIKEKEDAEKYLDFLKKYYNENKIELQKELGVCQYKEKQISEQNKELKEKVEILEKQLEETKTEFQISKADFEKTEKSLKEDLSASSKAASDYWKEYQTIKTELFSVKKDAEFLRQQLRYPSASASQSQSGAIPPPPVIPKPLMDFFEQLGNIQLPPALPNSNFLPTSSPINPPSIGQDIQNYHSSLSNMPFSVPQNQNLFNPIDPASQHNFAYPNPNLENIMPLDQEIYNPDYQYASLPNISYANSTMNQGFNPNVQQQNWEPRNTYTPSNPENPNTSQSFQQF